MRKMMMRHGVSRLRGFATIASKEKKYSTSDKVGAGVFLGMSAVTFGLGLWQTKRYYWKVDLVAERSRKVNEETMVLTEQLKAVDLDTIKHSRVDLVGKFLNDKTIIMGPRASPIRSAAMTQSGFFIYTPFLQDDGQMVIVNRGWVPRKEILNNEIINKEILISKDEETKVPAVIAAPESSGKFTPENNLQEKRFYWLDGDAIRQACDVPIDTIIVDKVQFGDDEGVLPIAKPISTFMEFKVNPYTHIGYAATWYGLSAIALAFVKLRFLK